ncbi:DJ-1 family glyoxalase III [Leptospira sp. GIMC2001]|uniref:DJ-1 family glyoxalase III n=1 Tax=Leptospira sp. GIMC2001 TaxID=1513297 RepID=UPI00234BB0C3|nr:DJ-1 family glyoxalase III [Leptospira sp. GIMC2001]WCL49300.1 DJ-1/PfpI family protein [Leptospira sp. GIMC2001]
MKKVMIPLAEGFEEMEAIILIDVLRRGKVQVTSCGLKAGPIIASRGTIHTPDSLITDNLHGTFDMIVLPGGLKGTEGLMNSQELSNMLINHANNSGWIGAICAAPNILRKLNIISGDDPYTAYPSTLQLADGGKYSGARIVIQNRIITSIAVGSAFEFALKILEILQGEDIEKEVRAGLMLPI